ncbi:MAG: gamma-glutamyl-gamma-aminobutyrate hydrolase family protein [bacterium]|jgi:putative glutamine amidotransferase|nr:gamma-glutamyl-gamma-aminobutyrate hydrolase family protein [bacterium]
MRPLIGISMEASFDPAGARPLKPGHRLDYLLSTYPAMVRAAGARPVLLAVGQDPVEAAELVERLDGLLLSGGSDLDPVLWGEEELEAGGHVLPLGESERVRSRWEDVLVKAALERRLPLLGICRGMQQLNVSLGGDLWQDLERQVGRAGHPGGDDPFDLVHGLLAVGPAEDPLIGAMGGAWVTSTHHQGLRRLGQDLEVLATAVGEPEVVEAVRLGGHPFLLGVQWHPERMAGSPLTTALMASFLVAVERRRGRAG